MMRINKVIALFTALSFTASVLISCAQEAQPSNDLEDAKEVTYSDSSFIQVSNDEIRHEEDFADKSDDTEPVPETNESVSSEEETDEPESEESVTDKEDEAVEVGGQPDEPKYIDGVLIVNKTYPLPSTYNPGVDSTAKAAFDTMAANAYSDGVSLYIISDFRTYDYQAGLYQRYVNRSGQAEADRYSARAGHSEHQTGLAFDLNSLEQSFGQTAAGKWLAEHCHEYGFIIRYPEDKEHITGYMYEPWHIRYLGVDMATKIYESGLCLEEYFGITSQYAD